MPKVIEGNLSAKGLKLAIVAGRFNDFITGRLVDGALDVIGRSGGDTEATMLVKVPGAFELALAAKAAAASKKFDAVICLGALLRGETPHFDYLASTVTKELGAIGLESGISVINGVLTCNTMEQAVDRAGLKTGNKGFDAAVAAIEMVELMKQL